MIAKYFLTSNKIRKFLPFLKVDRPTDLGRWKPLDNSRQLNRRIDMANEDHCGPCGTHVTSDAHYNEKKQRMINMNMMKDKSMIQPHYPKKDTGIK